ncbi:MAG TPA: membrane or secreted protein [Pirellulales bacterium]|nr:membrane or secreted protein [Pirellulales bacterium]
MARWAIWLLVCASVFTAGCRGTSYPDLFHPGTIPQQLHSAERFDPYPDNDAGPTMEGVRPPGFDRPWPEPVQARWTFPNGRPPAQ